MTRLSARSASFPRHKNAWRLEYMLKERPGECQSSVLLVIWKLEVTRPVLDPVYVDRLAEQRNTVNG